MNFLASWFLPALAAVAGPTLIHLLNRRRYRTQQWAAMQFLREAVKRNRRAIQIRDFILLAIRTLVVLLFVLAMARPYWIGGGQQAYNGTEPIHAVIVLDNSLSMGYTALDKSLLDEAKAQATNFIETLPSGSEVSVIPMCRQPNWFNVGAYSSREDALNAVEQIRVVDQEANLRTAAEKARLALEEDSGVQTKRVVLLGDLQANGWEDNSLEETLDPLGDVQVVAVQPADTDNSWISDFYLRDGIADAESTGHFIGTVRHEGLEPRDNVTVSLIVDDQVVAEQILQLQPGQATTVNFEHQFVTAGTSKDPVFARAELTLDTDRLPMDDRRVCVVPVIARVPVVFIDQYGRDEDLERGRLGESFMLRHLLAPTLDEDVEHKSLIDVIHRTIEDFTIEDLQDARCVIISGSVAPNVADVVTLREYAEQGGQVLITAGGLFETTSWNAAAWDDGNGFLPVGLSPEPVGSLPPANTQQWPTFGLNPETFDDPIYNLQIPEEEFQDLVSAPIFYKAISADLNSLDTFDEKELSRVQDLLDSDRRQTRWLNWTNPLGRHYSEFTPEQIVARNRPRVLGQYDNKESFLVERRIGQGHVQLLTSGVFPEWNDLSVDTGVLLLDRIVRTSLVRSLPERTMPTQEEMVIPVSVRHQHADHKLTWPINSSNGTEAISVDVFANQKYGVVIRGATDRGFYQLVRVEDETGGEVPVMLLGFNGTSEESNLTLQQIDELRALVPSGRVRWLAAGAAISLEGETYLGNGTWRWLMYCLLLLLLVEMAVLTSKQRDENPSTGGAVI